jgi:hypothetical protein
MFNDNFNTSPFVPASGRKPTAHRSTGLITNAQHQRAYATRFESGSEIAVVISSRGISAVGPAGARFARAISSLL